VADGVLDKEIKGTVYFFKNRRLVALSCHWIVQQHALFTAAQQTDVPMRGFFLASFQEILNVLYTQQDFDLRRL